MSKHGYRSSTRNKPAVLPEPPDLQKARRLPLPGPGIKVTIPLHLLPAYLELYGLAPIEGQPWAPVGMRPVVLVRRTAKRTRRSNGKKADVA
jgi:hypothetical protein